MRLILSLLLLASSASSAVLQLSGGSVVLSGGSASVSLTTDRQRGGVELFIDAENLVSISGVTRSVNKPAKYGSSAIFGDDATDTWDDDKPNSSVIRVADGDWRMWYAGRPDEFHVTNLVNYICYAVSTNGIDWTRPIVGLTEYDGSTANNIVSTVGSARDGNPIISVDLDCITFGNFVWNAANATNWSKGQDVTPSGQNYLTWGTSDFFQMRDGTWRTYSQLFLDSKRQGGIAYGGQSITNAYTPRSAPMPGADAASTSVQNYWWTAHYHSGNWIAFVPEFSTATQMLDLNLFFSRDGFSWAKVSDEWIPNGAGSTWDSKIVLSNKSLVRDGNTWRYYYSGGDVLHNASSDFNLQIGLATIGYQRIGQVTGTGTVTTRDVIPIGGLTLNADASGGSLTVAVLSGGTALSGYGHGDFDTITSDTYEIAGTWGGLNIPTSIPVQLEITLSSATVYAYSVGVPDSQIIE